MKKLRAVASMAIVASLILAAMSCRFDLAPATLAAPAIDQFIAYRMGLDELVIDQISPAYPSGTSIRYTLDGSDPDSGSAALTADSTISTVASGATLKAYASLDGFVDSEIATAVVDDLVATLATPPMTDLMYSGGTIYILNFMSGYPAGTVVKYTFDGTDPTEATLGEISSGTTSLYCSAPFTMKARAYCDGYNPSAIATATDGDM